MSVDLLDIEGLKELEHRGPIVMVNLMRFHERRRCQGGRAR
jgi:hypothetical protein